MITVADTRPLRRWMHGVDRPHLVVCCPEHPDLGGWSRAVIGPRCRESAQAVVQLSTCLAFTSPAVLLELIAGGARGITVALDGCGNPADADSVVAQAGAFLSALDHPWAITRALTLPRDSKRGKAWPILGDRAVPVSRRALFGLPDGLNLVEPSEHPTKRLVAVLRELAAGDGWGSELDAIPTGIARFTASGCAGSGVCARTCPVDALTMTRTESTEANPDQDATTEFRLTFDPAKCTGCGQCVKVCPEAALKDSGEYVWSSLLAGEFSELRAGLIRRCARCGVGHGESGELCAVCSFRVANPFGSMMPPGHKDAR